MVAPHQSMVAPHQSTVAPRRHFNCYSWLRPACSKRAAPPDTREVPVFCVVQMDKAENECEGERVLWVCPGCLSGQAAPAPCAATPASLPPPKGKLGTRASPPPPPPQRPATVSFGGEPGGALPRGHAKPHGEQPLLRDSPRHARSGSAGSGGLLGCFGGAAVQPE